MGFVLLTLIYLLPATLVIFSLGYLRDRAPKGLSAMDTRLLKALKIYVLIIAIAYSVIAAWIVYDIVMAPPLDPMTNSAPDTFELRAAAATTLTGLLTCFAFPLWYAGRAVMNTLLRKAGK